MIPFLFERAADAADASRRFAAAPGAHYIAGGTTLVDLMQVGVAAPARLVEILDLRGTCAAVEVDAAGATIGALATMAEVAAHPAIRAGWTAASQALDQAASAQIRNAATIGGTLLQRTRCSGFRDPASACNKRQPGSGCAALAGGHTRDLAVFGTSPHCIASYPGDLAVALLALDAQVTVLEADGETRRSMAIEALHRSPGDRPDLDTTLAPGELILGVHLPAGGWDRSVYLKLRDRDSYAFALVSAAVALRLEEGRVVDLRIALGGLASRPWRCRSAEAALRGRVLDRALAEDAAALCLDGAEADAERAFKVELGRRVVTRALLVAAGCAPTRRCTNEG
jgi:xanthine dehydrogenase YagS FAD-binding subunit